MTSLSPAQLRNFKQKIKSYYKTHGRQLPWREDFDPYHILVSEIMLQQTQVDRVIPKYQNFLSSFPSVIALAEAPLLQVLSAWQGLGYNRRALALKQTSEKLLRDYGGEMPHTIEELQTLPGIGPYTAKAVATFAFNQAHVLIETNIRTVFIHEFFPDQIRIYDLDILAVIEATLDRKNPREWYYALMDYGAMLKKKYPNPSRKSAHYIKQSKFLGSDRQIRGFIIKTLTTQKSLSLLQLGNLGAFPLERLEKNLQQLVQEGLIRRIKNSYQIS